MQMVSTLGIGTNVMATIEHSLVSNRLVIRSMRLEDVNSKLIGWLNSPTINRYLEVRRATVTEHSQKEFVKQKIESSSEYYFLVMDSRHNGIGTASLSWDGENRKAAIGLMIGDAEYWNKGLGSEIIEVLCSFAFDSLGVRKVVAGILEPNKASLRAFMKAGFSMEAQLKEEAVLEDGEIVDSYRVCKFS